MQIKQLKSDWKNWENEDSSWEKVTTAENIKMKKKWIWNKQGKQKSNKKETKMKQKKKQRKMKKDKWKKLKLK